MELTEIVQEIRKHPKIGEGSCHPWDECYSDQELAAMFESCKISSVKQAEKLGLSVLDVFDDRIADARNSAF